LLPLDLFAVQLNLRVPAKGAVEILQPDRIATALVCVRPAFFGAEARYLRSYDGIGFDPFAGQALFVGPTLYASLSKTIAISAAWGVQVAGHAVDIPGSLDLKNFERHRAQLRLMYNF
jgi:hypothetical protein